MRDKPLPSIAPSPGISTPRVARVIGTSKLSLPEGRIRAWRSPDIEEQQRLYLQAKKEETFWSLRMRNRP
jgi:hypothetical protein